MFGFGKKKYRNEELEKILAEVNMNASNNYKDAAQEAYARFLAKHEELMAAGSLSEKQITHYAEELEKLKTAMAGFSHDAQRADYTGYKQNR